MSRITLGLASLAAAAGLGWALQGCGGCVREARATAATVEPTQSCLQLGFQQDQSGVLICGEPSAAGVNHCSHTLWILPHPGGLDGGLAPADAGLTDGGEPAASPLGPDALSFAPESAISFPLNEADARQDPDGTLRWDLPAALGSQSLVAHFAMGPKK